MAAGSLPMMWAAWASFSDAWSSPSALMILARRSRSASACRAIARFISGGRSTSLTSTADTSTPHSSVRLSMLVFSIVLIFSLFMSRPSIFVSPRAERRVVCAGVLAAYKEFATRVAPAAADAGGAEAEAPLGTSQRVEQVDGDARAGGRQRVADGDGAAVHVRLRPVEPQLPLHGEILRSEGLVHLHQVHLLERHPGLLERLARRGRRADAHE